jgi:hypothetical protein
MWDRQGTSARATVDRAAFPVTAAEDAFIATRTACLEQILEAFCDIADRDDIHQAAQRLLLVQDWIRHEAAEAAADPLFSSRELAL